MVLPHPAVMIQITKMFGERFRIKPCREELILSYLPKNNLRNTQKRGIIMMMHKKLQKVLAIALMTSFFSTSFVMGVSEAAPARQGGGQRPAQSQQVRPVPKSNGQQARPSAHQGAPRQQSRPMQRNTPNRQGPVMHKNSPRQHGPAMQRNTPGHQGPVVHKNTPRQQGSSMHKNNPGHQGSSMHKNGPGHQGPVMHKGQPMSHKSGSTHHSGPAVHKSGPVMHKGGPVHRGQPMTHKDGPNHRGPIMHKSGPVVHHPIPQQHHPAPEYHPAPPPPDYYPDNHRSMHSEDWLGALIVGGILGAIIANSGHHTSNADYAEVY